MIHPAFKNKHPSQHAGAKKGYESRGLKRQKLRFNSVPRVPYLETYIGLSSRAGAKVR